MANFLIGWWSFSAWRRTVVRGVSYKILIIFGCSTWDLSAGFHKMKAVSWRENKKSLFRHHSSWVKNNRSFYPSRFNTVLFFFLNCELSKTASRNTVLYDWAPHPRFSPREVRRMRSDQLRLAATPPSAFIHSLDQSVCWFIKNTRRGQGEGRENRIHFSD